MYISFLFWCLSQYVNHIGLALMILRQSLLLALGKQPAANGHGPSCIPTHSYKALLGEFK